MALQLEITKKQQLFIEATATEVLFGGAAGGGKSYGQLIDALLYALKYKGSKQLILRRTFPELEKSLIRAALSIYPKEIAKYSGTSHTYSFVDGSLIDFAYCDNENDVYKYQSAEYDVIRFDELTHFSETMYLYLMSRLRGANNFPKQVKSSTNPGGVGHAWVKARFIDPVPPMQLNDLPEGSRVFIPSLVQDNKFIMDNDPDYLKRLDNLPEEKRKALKYGEWNVFEGQYFTMWDPSIHVIEPFELPNNWRRYVTLDYGRDMLAAYWVAVDESGKAYVYREAYESGLLASEAVQLINRMTVETISTYYAPPDLWNKHSDTGRSTADIFLDAGVYLVKAVNNRIQGWYDLAEWLKPIEDEQGQKSARIVIFNKCRNLMRTLPSLQYDNKNPNDVSNDPHELTHAPDAIRYFVAGRPVPNRTTKPKPIYNFDFERPKPSATGYGQEIRII